jgi:hypothetical protein
MSYVNIEELKEYSGAHDEDNLLQNYIDSAEDIVNTYLGYSPTLHNYIQYFDGTGTYELQLKAKPIINIISVEIDGQSISLSEFYNTTNDEFLYYSKIFPVGRRNIKVEYNAGWGYEPDYDDLTKGTYLPMIIKMTVLRIASILQSESNQNIGVSSKSFGDSGTRTFINYTDYSKYLLPISIYKILVI